MLPATHNSMSVPLPGWFSAEQERPIGGQLEDGIRGLLLDTHYGDRLANGRVRTVLRQRGGAARRSAGRRERRQASTPRCGSAPGSASAARASAGCTSATRFCELGATPLADGLDDIHDFLVTHPGEVVVIVNQDYVTPADFVDGDRRRGPDAVRVHAAAPAPTGRRCAR